MSVKRVHEILGPANHPWGLSWLNLQERLCNKSTERWTLDQTDLNRQTCIAFQAVEAKVFSTQLRVRAQSPAASHGRFCHPWFWLGGCWSCVCLCGPGLEATLPLGRSDRHHLMLSFLRRIFSDSGQSSTSSRTSNWPSDVPPMTTASRQPCPKSILAKGTKAGCSETPSCQPGIDFINARKEKAVMATPWMLLPSSSASAVFVHSASEGAPPGPSTMCLPIILDVNNITTSDARQSNFRAHTVSTSGGYTATRDLTSMLMFGFSISCLTKSDLAFKMLGTV